MQQFHQAIKKQLPVSTLMECESFGDIYFRGWRTSPEECRTEIEFSIQDLMFHAVVAYRKPLGALDVGVNKVRTLNPLIAASTERGCSSQDSIECHFKNPNNFPSCSRYQ